MRLSLLGPVELADDGGGLIDLESAKRRALLAVLGLELGQVVPIERLIAVLWGDDPPPRARTALHGHVSALRKVLGPKMRLVTRDPGYVLVAEPSAVDVHRFRELTAVAREAEDAAAAGVLLTALRLWRGPALDGLAGRALPDSLAADLEEMRREALAAFAGRLLALGRGDEAVGRLRAAVDADPLHEPLIKALVLCLNQSGRQADALGVYHAARRRLADELGIDPGPALQEAYQVVLRGSGPPGQAAQAGVRAVSGRPVVPAPVQLPRAPSGFVGRASELAWLRERLDDDRPVLVCGPAGIGKTALVLRWAHELADQFPDGQIFASLRGFDPAGPAEPGAVLAGFLRALGTSDAQVPHLPEERAALFRTKMAGRRMLVVLDDAGSADQVRPALPGDARSLVVVTSRNRLAGLIAQDGAAVLTLPAVSSGEALEMLSAAAGADRVAQDRGGALRLAGFCDHLPLALRVATARLVTSPGLTLAALAEELRDEQMRLETLATDDAGVSVEAALSLSVRALPAPAARLFTLLGLHPGPDIDVYAAAALADSTTKAARQALNRMDACHLAHQPASGRYVSHDLIRLYSRALARTLPPREQYDALARLLDYYLAATRTAAGQVISDVATVAHSPLGNAPKATPAFAGSAGAIVWFEAEEKNIRALVRSADLHEHAWRLARNCHAMYDATSRRVDMAACMADGLRAARAAGNQHGTASLLGSLGWCLAEQGRHEQALDCLRGAADLVDDASDPRALYGLMTKLAHVETTAGQWEQASQHLDVALPAARKMGPGYEASVLNGMAWNYLQQAAPERALPFSQAAVNLITTLVGKDVLIAAYLHTYAAVLEQLGRLDEAQASYRQALGVAEACGSRRSTAASYHGLGTTHLRLGDFYESELNLRIAIDLYGMLGQTADAAQASQQLEQARSCDRSLNPASLAEPG